jgi:molecular chaperone GrpE (heat shock protein)
VVEEVRPGYRWNGEVLRFAEVAAVRETTEH